MKLKFLLIFLLFFLASCSIDSFKLTNSDPKTFEVETFKEGEVIYYKNDLSQEQYNELKEIIIEGYKKFKRTGIIEEINYVHITPELGEVLIYEIGVEEGFITRDLEREKRLGISLD